MAVLSCEITFTNDWPCRTWLLDRVMMSDIHDAVTVCGIVMCTCQASQTVYSESRWSYLNMPSMKLKQIVATVVLNTVM